MKKIIALILAVAMTLCLLAACGSKEPEPSVEPSVEPSADPTPANVDLTAFYNDFYAKQYPADENGDPTGPAVDNIAAMSEMLDGWYPGLSAISTEQCLVYMPMMSGVPYELALIEVTNADDLESVKTILQARIDTETANHFNYPMVIENWEKNSRIVVNGNYIMMVASSDCEDYVSAFNALFA